MTQVFADRCGELTTTYGSGTLTLNGALDTFQTFAIVGSNNMIYYSIVSRDYDEWEVGNGTIQISGLFRYLQRTAVIDGSSGVGVTVNFTGPASLEVKAVYPSTFVSIQDANVALVSAYVVQADAAATAAANSATQANTFKVSAQAAAVSAIAAATSANAASDIAVSAAGVATSASNIAIVEASVATVQATSATTQASIAGVYASIAQAAASAAGGAPQGASYILTSANTSLAQSRVLTRGTFIFLADSGPGGNVQVSLDVSATDLRYYQLTSGQAVASVAVVNTAAITSINAVTNTLSTRIQPVSLGGTGVSTATSGQLLIGNGTGFTVASITPGTNITVVNGPGSLTINASVTQGGITWMNVATSFTAVAGNGYMVDTSASVVTGTLPVAATLGDTIPIVDTTGQFGAKNFTVGANGLPIMGLSQDMTVATPNASFVLVFQGATNGWRLT